MKSRKLTCDDIEESTEENIPTTPAMLAAIDEADASPTEQDLTIEVVRLARLSE